MRGPLTVDTLAALRYLFCQDEVMCKVGDALLCCQVAERVLQRLLQQPIHFPHAVQVTQQAAVVVANEEVQRQELV